MTYQHFERPTTHKPENAWVRPIIYLVLVAITGLIAGGLGFALLMRLYEPAVRFNLLPENTQLQRRSVSVQIDQPIISTAQAIQPSLVLFLKHRASRNIQGDLLIDPSDILSQGVALTSDGWMLGQIPTTFTGLLDVYIDDEFYPVSKTVQDAFTTVTFVKIEASNLIPAQFSESLPAAGAFVFSSAVAVGGGYQVGTDHVVLSRWTPIKSKFDAVKNATQLSEFIQLERDASDQVVFASDGAVLGVTRAENHAAVIPARQIKLSFEQMLKGSKDIDPGLYYVDTALETRVGGRGAIIFHPTRNPITPNGIAAKAKLANLDTILSINGTALDDEVSFEYAWRKHQHDDTIRIVIRRNGREATIEIKN